MTRPGVDEDEPPSLLESKPEPGASPDLVLADAGMLSAELDPAVAVRVARIGDQLVVGALARAGMAGAHVSPRPLRRSIFGHDGPARIRRITFDRPYRRVRRQMGY
jgi:hypothetical protein